MQIAFINVEDTPGCPRAGLRPWSLITLPLAPSPLPFTLSTPVPQGITALKTPHTTPLKTPRPCFAKCVCFSFCHPAHQDSPAGPHVLGEGTLLSSHPVSCPGFPPVAPICLPLHLNSQTSASVCKEGVNHPRLCKQDMHIDPSCASLQCIHQSESYFQVEKEESAHLVVVIMLGVTWGAESGLLLSPGSLQPRLPRGLTSF